MKLLRRALFLAIAVLAFAAASKTQEMQEGRLLRFPDVYKDKIVFSYAGDLWLRPPSRGAPQRRPRPPHPHASRTRAIPEVLARRLTPRLHRPIRRQSQRLRDSRRRRRAQATDLQHPPHPHSART